MKLADALPWLVGAGVVWLYYREPKPGAVAASGSSSSSEPSNVPVEFRDFKPPPMPGYSRMKGSDVPAAIMPKLRPLLAAPLGTITKLPTDGRDIAAVIEVHFHEPGGPVKPWGYHKGVSLYERKGANA